MKRQRERVMRLNDISKLRTASQQRKAACPRQSMTATIKKRYGCPWRSEAICSWLSVQRLVFEHDAPIVSGTGVQQYDNQGLHIVRK